MPIPIRAKAPEQQAEEADITARATSVGHLRADASYRMLGQSVLACRQPNPLKWHAIAVSF